MSTGVATQNPLTVRVSANFGLGLIPDSLDFILSKTGVPAVIRPLEHDQIVPHASRLAMGGTLAENSFDVFLIRLQNWATDASSAPSGFEAESMLHDYVDVLLNTLEIVAAGGYRIVIGLCEVSDIERQTPEYAAAINQILAFRERHSSATVVELSAAFVANEYEPRSLPLKQMRGMLPYDDTSQAIIGAALGRELYRQTGSSFKVIAVDCDGTLWTGECSSPETLTLSDSNLEVQRFLVDLHERGWLLCLCSKNEPEDVSMALEGLAGMVLRPDHIAASEVSWNPKSEGLMRLAERFSLSLGSFVFMDDDSFECAEVRFAHPDVVVIQLHGDLPNVRRILRHIWPADAAVSTAEDGLRKAWYQKMGAWNRGIVEQGLERFLAEVGFSVSIAAYTPDDWTRVLQLSHRATQWNISPQSDQALALKKLTAHGSVYCLRAEDHHGKYGLIGVTGGELDGVTYKVHFCVLSCRALGKQVEFTILRHIGNIACSMTCKMVELELIPTKRNKYLQKILERVGFQVRAVEDRMKFAIEPHVLVSAFEERPYGFGLAGDSIPSESSANGTEEAFENPWSLEAASTSAEGLSDIAMHLNCGDALLRRLLAVRGSPLNATRPIVLPRTPTESEIVGIWRSVTGIHEISVDDDFFDLQADSLRAVEILARIKRRFGVELPIDMLFEQSFSVETIAEALELDAIATADPSFVAEELAKLRAADGTA